MSYRSNPFRKTKQSLALGSTDGATPQQTWSPRPLDGDPRRPVRNFTDPRQLPGMERVTASDGLTVLMPTVQQFRTADSMPTQVLPPIQAAQSAENLAATQILPALPVVPPPSARHVDPRAEWSRLHVEDNDLLPETPGRHVLSELIALDPTRELAETAQRVIADFGGPDTAAKDPARRESVRRFRHARDMQRSRERRAAAVISSADETLRRIHDMWNAWDEKLAEWNAALCGQEAVIAGYGLAAAYEEHRQRIAEENARRVAEGQPPLDATATTFTRGMQAELKQLIVQRATAGSAVA